MVEPIFGKDLKKNIKTVKGKVLVGLKYIGPFDELDEVKKIQKENREKFHTVIATDETILPIVLTEGTGMVHTAVSAGVEDFKLGQKLGLPMIPVIADNADYLPTMGFLAGKNAKKNPRLILDFVEKTGFAFKIHNYKHRYPACWRCKAELVWKVADEWYIAMDKSPLRVQKSKVKSQKYTLRERMIEVAKKIQWKPAFGLERELDWLKNMHDWLISKKNRYWGLALPIYECNQCGWFDVLGSKEELKSKAVSGWKEFENHSPHKPFIDEVKIKCSKCNLDVSRVDDVGNVWLDAGIVPFSTYVDPKSGKLSYVTDKLYWKEWFPADFITESFPGQFKNWFYSMIAMSTVLEDINPYQTVLGYASVLGEDGRPMHKSWGNAIDFNTGAEKIGVDVMRWMFLTHDPEQNILFGYKKADETRRKFHLLLWNIYSFFVTYANIDKNQKSKIKNQKYISNIKNILDRWIIAKLNILIVTVTDSLKKFDPAPAALAIEQYVADLSQWYIRRSRDRVGPTSSGTTDKNNFYLTLYDVLTNLCRILAPFTPFISEEIYRNLTGDKSVHLADWPTQRTGKIEQRKNLLEEMELVRKICELGHSKRKEAGIKVRQPLQKLKTKNVKAIIDKDLIQLIKDELNVKEIDLLKGKEELMVELDTNLTTQLIEEGKAREIVRQIQLKRKELGCSLAEKVQVVLPDWPLKFTDYIKEETLASKIAKGNSLRIDRI